jgi:hypothetical protein
VGSAPDAFGHVKVDRILLVAGAARRGAQASIRPLTFGGDPPTYARAEERKPRIHVRGREMRYELCLRPLFFLRSSAEERLRVLVHELWHIGAAGDGTLDPNRRHRPDNQEESERFSRMVAQELGPRLDLGILEHEGELRVPMWLERPPSLVPPDLETRLEYDERDLFLGIVRQRTGSLGNAR